MTRSPLFYPLHRGSDMDAGGVADLQTDVMRFMAILSLCLVAIFALVQSIPLTPAKPAKPPESAAEPEVVETARAITRNEQEAPVEVPEKIELTRPVTARTVVTSDTVSLQRPVAEPVRQTAPAHEMQAGERPTTAAAPAKQGFTLQFENDAALMRLVARQRVGLYAITREQSSRMNVEDKMISFWQSSLPGSFHEMDETTVPEDVLAAYMRGNRLPGTTWGVTLPADMARELDEYLGSADGGTLVISASGKIDLKH